MSLIDHEFMQLALEQAFYAQKAGEVPVGAVLTYQNKVIASNYNQPIKLSDPSAHAEILVLRQAGQIMRNYRLLDTTLYVTLEPCVMCMGALWHARVNRVVYGAIDSKVATVDNVFKMNCEGGVLAEPCAQLLKSFFEHKRHVQKIR